MNSVICYYNTIIILIFLFRYGLPASDLLPFLFISILYHYPLFIFSDLLFDF